MEWGNLLRKLSILALAVGVTSSTVPGGASAASSVQPQFTKSALSLIQQHKTYISPQINTKSTADIRVIVQLSGQPAAIGKYATKQGISSLASTATEAAVNSQQTDVLQKAATAGLDLKVNYKYNTVLNGFEITIPANEIPELATITGVTSIYENSTWYALPDEDTDVAVLGTTANGEAPLKQIGADLAWEAGYTGAGLKVGVIDTGVDYKHPDIAAAYKGGWDSFYNDDDPYEEAPDATKSFEGTSHGTHVSGTIIGRATNPTSEIVQKGVAYGADLYVYKVLGYNPANPDSASGSSAQVIDGIEHAIKDHMDVINLSLGSDAEKDVNSPDAIAINNAVLSGVVAVIANGNAGPDYYTLGSPATSQLGISVGAATSKINKYWTTLTPTLVNAETVTSVTYATYKVNIMAWEATTEEVNFTNLIGVDSQDIVYVGLGADSDYVNKDVTGKIVLASRGTLAFDLKIANAKKYKAKALVIFNGNAKSDNPKEVDLNNSIPGRDDYIDVDSGDNYGNITTFDMKGTEGRALARALVQNSGTQLETAFGADYHQSLFLGDTLAGFSSAGPNVDSKLSIKPDFVAPGVGILSTWPAYGKFDTHASYDEAYKRISGTSMAAPHVAGLALLIKQAHPNWTPFDIRAALANTADVLPGDDKGTYDVYQQGAGRVNVSHAIDTDALLQSIEPITILDKNYSPINVINYNDSANFGVLAPGAAGTENLQLKNTGSADLTYTAEIEWHGDTPAEITANLDHSVVAAAAGKTTPFTLDLNVSKAAVTGSSYEGQINLTAVGQPTLHLPFSIYVGTELPDSTVGIQEIALTKSIIHPKLDTPITTDLSYKLTADDANYYEIDLYNLNDELIGFMDIAESEGDSFETGVYNFTGIDGSYFPYDAKGNPVLDKEGNPVIAHLIDGIYKINVFYAHITPANKVTSSYNGFTSLRVSNEITPVPTPTATPAPVGSGGLSPTPTASATAAPTGSESTNSVLEQGFQQAPVKAVAASKDGVTTITVTDNDLKAALASAASSKTAVVISVPTISDTEAKLSLTTDQLKQLAGIQPQSTLIISVAGSAVSLPVSLLANVPAGTGFDLVITKAADQASKFTTSATGATVVGTPVSFEANWTTASGSTALEIPNDVFIKRSFTIPGAIQPNTTGVLYEENGKITPVSSVFKVQADGTTIVTVNRPGFSVYAAVSRPVTFTDIASSTAAADITALANKLIIEGTSATTFSPKSNLTRAEFTALLARSLGLRSASTASFTDVKASDWYAADVAAAYEAGLILGTGKGKFAPTAKVTRQELAVILDRALKLTGVELKVSNPSFSTYADDAKIASYAKDSVRNLSAAGVISSNAGLSFNPTTAATRETVASALRQLLSKTGLID
ncbi:S8 family serine peptidase [Paenibacillus sp. 19GGS1-52]|uniref:S8 family serine peptidase n=1 Tax=Paenibacillus sp. 19GGS1-52 TaxID=2758563 RepID=UPI0023BA42BA|nr:S8 family serine peptidase [Paenibacillus sp. 19GGS1-52]ULO07368.1 S8 family serine peptidase [Paenibacillus sp. 19GGS1-52]